MILFFLFFRFALGWQEIEKYSKQSRIRVTGNIDNIYQNKSECIITVGRFWTNLRKPCTFSRTDRVSIVGRVSGEVIDKILGRLWLDSAELVILDDGFDSTVWHKVFSRLITNTRENIVSVYQRYLPEPESSLVAGIVLGYKKDIGQKFYEMMVKSGTVHIAVASGYNIMLVGGTILSISFWIFKRKWASILATVAMLLYALEAGGEPPVIRAVIMAGVVFLAAVKGRKAIGWWILLVTGWLMVLFEPWLLVSVSFQLSMAASVGLMVVEPAISKWFGRTHERLNELLGTSGILTSCSTLITTMPIIWWHFGRMSWIGILSNILILPLIPILMVVGALMQIIPEVFFWPTYTLAHWIVEVINFFGN